MAKVKVIKNDETETKLVNTVINKFKDFTEIIYYKKIFEVRYGSQDYDIVESSTGEILKKKQRNFFYDGETLKPLHDSATVQKMVESIRASCRRAKDNFYGYGLSNHWDYFCTFTVSVNNHEHTDEATKHHWHVFRRRLQRACPSIKILAALERHETNLTNLHFHALLGACDLEKNLIVAVNPHTGKAIKHKGRQVYNLNLWTVGFSTVVKLDKENNQLQVLNYLIEYTTKASNIGYNKKKYYHTNNLDFKNKQLSLCGLPELMDNVALDKSLIYKETDKMIVFRQFSKQVCND